MIITNGFGGGFIPTWGYGALKLGKRVMVVLTLMSRFFPVIERRGRC